MNVDIFRENQIHERVYVGAATSQQLSSVLEKARPAHGLLAGVHPYGDTMFNSMQLSQVLQELETLAESFPDLGAAVATLKDLMQEVISDRGYLWLSGD